MSTHLAFWQISSCVSWYGDIRECLCATITDLQNPSANYRGLFLTERKVGAIATLISNSVLFYKIINISTKEQASQ
ncbi:hypothetical protein LC593_01855 [Nostoc sp. CHAB 5844]|nr:hypothetical protein [Nostoc sp. CHAB 5844]